MQALAKTHRSDTSTLAQTHDQGPAKRATKARFSMVKALLPTASRDVADVGERKPDTKAGAGKEKISAGGALLGLSVVTGLGWLAGKGVGMLAGLVLSPLLGPVAIPVAGAAVGVLGGVFGFGAACTSLSKYEIG